MKSSAGTIPDDSILLTIFAGEREDSEQNVKESIQARHESKTRKGKKNEPSKTKLAKKHLKTRILSV
jgi:hypothetical protein